MSDWSNLEGDMTLIYLLLTDRSSDAQNCENKDAPNDILIETPLQFTSFESAARIVESCLGFTT